MGGKSGLWARLAAAFAAEPVEQKPRRPSASGPRESRLAREIVGESHYQHALADICGGKTPEGHLFACRAELRPEPDNPHDSNAVAVFIQDHKVGYLPKQSAKRYGKAFGAASVSCAAQIVGGWRRREGRTWDEGHFGVELDLREP